ncbi:MAG: helix-turn-helix domain-containing protein [Dehalococcoidia bacterium]
MADSTKQQRPWFEGTSDHALPARFLEEMGLAADAEARRLGSPTVTVDLAFLVFLRRFSRFGYFRFGPLAIDVELIQDIVERGLPRVPQAGHSALADDMVRFTQAVIGEVQRSGRRRVDELHYLLAFMRWPEGLPARVFGELGVSPEEVEQFARGPELAAGDPEKLYSPEEAADYLGVHVQTVRTWIRSGRLRASRLAGQRALRIKASDLISVLEPIDPKDA